MNRNDNTEIIFAQMFAGTTKTFFIENFFLSIIRIYHLT